MHFKMYSFLFFSHFHSLLLVLGDLSLWALCHWMPVPCGAWRRQKSYVYVSESHRMWVARTQSFSARLAPGLFEEPPQGQWRSGEEESPQEGPGSCRSGAVAGPAVMCFLWTCGRGWPGKCQWAQGLVASLSRFGEKGSRQIPRNRNQPIYQTHLLESGWACRGKKCQSKDFLYLIFYFIDKYI